MPQTPNAPNAAPCPSYEPAGAPIAAAADGPLVVDARRKVIAVSYLMADAMAQLRKAQWALDSLEELLG